MISQHPIVLNIEDEKLWNSTKSFQFSQIQSICILKDATAMMDEGKHYYTLKLTIISSEDEIVLFDRFFNNIDAVQALGQFIVDIIQIHGLELEFDKNKLEFINNFSKYPCIDC